MIRNKVRFSGMLSFFVLLKNRFQAGWFASILLIPLMSSCGYLKNVKALTKGRIERENYVETVPFEMRKDLIVVQAQLNGDDRLHEFIFDTGAFNSKVEHDLAETLGLKVVAEKQNSTAQGLTRHIEVVQVDSVRLGNTWIKNASAGKLQYGTNSASPCIASSGIIGANMMKLAHWKIDYQNQKLQFSDTPFPRSEDFHVLPFECPALSGTPKINVNVNGREVENILFDVGYNGSLVLPMRFAEAFPTVHTDTLYDAATSGIYGTNLDTLLVKWLDVNVAGIPTKIPVTFSSLNKALLGNEFLKHFDVLIDYKHKEIALKKILPVNIAPLRPLLVAPYESVWKVIRVCSDLPVELGETFTKVNGLLPQEAFTDRCDFVLHPERLYVQGEVVLETAEGEIRVVKNANN